MSDPPKPRGQRANPGRPPHSDWDTEHRLSHVRAQQDLADAAELLELVRHPPNDPDRPLTWIMEAIRQYQAAAQVDATLALAAAVRATAPPPGIIYGQIPRAPSPWSGQ